MTLSSRPLSELQDSQLPESIEIEPVNQLRGTIRPPGSKSITNRAMVLAGLAAGPSTLRGCLESDDTSVMKKAWNDLGVNVRDQGGHVIEMDGCGGTIPAHSAAIQCENSGTTMRFMTAAVATGNGTYCLDGIERMRERPMQDLLDALQSQGIKADSQRSNGCPPIVIQGGQIRGGGLEMPGDVSSQFISALLMIAPYAGSNVDLSIDGELVSAPFVDMTVKMMRSFGAEVSSHESRNFRVNTTAHYRGQTYSIEPDATAASYFWGGAALTQGRVTITGIGSDSLQGDTEFVSCLEQMGALVERSSESISVTGKELHGIDVNMKEISDTFMTLAVIAVFAKTATRIRGVAHSRLQETDRVAATCTELSKLGVRVEQHDDGLTIHPTRIGELGGAEIETYDDHRIAMSMSLAGLRLPGIRITNPSCIQKTYPRYFHDLRDIIADTL